MYVCIYKYIYICKYTYIHTYTQYIYIYERERERNNTGTYGEKSPEIWVCYISLNTILCIWLQINL